MALGTLMIFNIVLVITAVILQVLLYKNKEMSKANAEMGKLFQYRQHAIEKGHVAAWELNDYATLLLTCYPPHLQNPKLAVEYAERAVSVTKSRNLTSLYTLASALYRVGDRQRGDQYIEVLLRLPPAPNITSGKSMVESVRAKITSKKTIG